MNRSQSFTLWYQRYTEKRKVKIDLFLNLMKNRQSVFIPLDHVQALNSIDVVLKTVKKLRGYGLLIMTS